MTCLTVGATTALWLNGRLSAATARYAMREPPRDVSEHEVVPRSPPHFSVRSSSVLYMGQGTFFGFMCRCMKGIMKMKIYEELKARGLIAQVTDEEQVRDLVNNGGATFYIGFDCTADSLTAGHFMALTLMKRLQMAGNKPIALIGGGTTMIGDPSGRTDMRKMLTKEDIDHNAECFRRQMSTIHRVRRGQGENGQQRRLAPRSSTTSSCSARSARASRSTICSALSATSSEWKRACPSSSSTT